MHLNNITIISTLKSNCHFKKKQTLHFLSCVLKQLNHFILFSINMQVCSIQEYEWGDSYKHYSLGCAPKFQVTFIY